MIAIIGLGNPGEKYSSTRHNIGFRVVDKLVEVHEAEPWQTREDCLVTEVKIEGVRVALAKPQTFMNRCGVAVERLVRYWPMGKNDLWVVHDDADLPLGTVKTKINGSDGGHNGIASLDKALGPDYWRIRLGIGRPDTEMDLADYVLAPFSESEENQIETVIDQLTEEMVHWISDKIKVTTLEFF